MSQLLSKQRQVTINAKNGAGNTHIRNIPVSGNPARSLLGAYSYSRK